VQAATSGEAGAVVAIEGIAAALARGIEGSAVDPVNIEVAVAVEVQHGSPAAFGFDDILLLGTATGVDFAQTEFSSDVDEAGRGRIRMRPRCEDQQQRQLRAGGSCQGRQHRPDYFRRFVHILIL
jgi:hypothetical protein